MLAIARRRYDNAASMSDNIFFSVFFFEVFF